MSNNNKKQKYKILILIAAMVLLTIAAFSAYGVVRAAIIKRECNVHRYITINLDGGTSSNMYWKSNVDRDATNYSKGEWIWGSAAGCWLRPKGATEDRLTSIYYDNQDPCEGTFYEHIDCVGATPYVWIEEPTKEGYEFAGWTYEVKTEIGDGGSWEVKEGKVSYDSGYYYFSAGAYATTGNSNGACANIYLTAKWEPIIYIDYSTDGGTIDCDWVHLESGWIRPNTGEAYLEYVSPDGSLNPYNDVSFNLRKTGYHFTQWTNNGRSGMDYGVFDQDTSYHYDTWYNHSYYNDYHNGQYVDLYPDWQLNYAKLDYNANGGYIEDSAEWALDHNGWVRRNGASGDEQYWAENVYYGQSCNPYNDTSFGLKKDGYRFAGWKIKGTTIMLDQDTTYGWSAYCSPLGIDLADGLGFTPQWVDLEAVWEPMYQIDVNGSLDGVIDYSQEWGTFDVYINGSLLENDQMDFMQSFPVGTKWEIKDIKSVTDGIKYVGDETYSGTLQVDTSVILPFMTDTTKYYRIAYDANGGTGTMDSQVVMYDSEVILSHNQFKRSGYEFAGWSRDKNANTLEYTDGQTVKNITSADSTITLYALWTPIDYSIVYTKGYTNNAKDDVVQSGIKYDKETTLISNPFTGRSYTVKYDTTTTEYDWDKVATPAGLSGTLEFAYWNILNNTYAAGTKLKNLTVKNGGKINATAQWKEKKFIFPVVSRPGYDFTGWYSAGDKKIYKGNTEYTISPAEIAFNDTFIAQWTARTDTKYTVRHWKEKLYLDNTTTYADPSKHDGTNYTLTDTDNLTGTTDSSVTPAVKTYTGFTSPSKVTVTIKGDGTTIVDYYYTRNWYDHQVELLLETATGSFESAPDNWSLAHVTAPNSQKNYKVTNGLCVNFRGKYEEPVSWYSDENDCYKAGNGAWTWKVGQDGKSHTKSNNNAYKVYVYRKAYGFNLESIIDGEKYLLEHGYGSVNIKINGITVATNVSNFSGSYRYGSTFDVTILENTGCDYIYQESYYTNANGNFKEQSNDRVISGQIIKDTSVYPAWRTTLDAVFNSNNGQSQTLTKHYTRATNESATNFNSTNYLLSDVSNWKKQYYVQLGWSDKADDNEKTFDLSRQDNYKLGEQIESAATRTESDWIKKNSPTKNLYMIWKENKAPTIGTGTLSEYYRTFYTGQTITNSMLMYDITATDDYDAQTALNNLHVQKVELLSEDRVVSTIYCNSSNRIDNFIIPQSKGLTSYKVYFETTDAGRVDVGDCSINTNSTYKETDKRTTVVSVQYKIVENQAPEINSVDKRIYKQTTDIKDVDALRKFIQQYQIAYDYEDNTDISHWWEVEGPNGTKQQLRKNLQVAESDETLQSIVDFITSTTNNETRQYDIKLTIKDQFNKTNNKEIKIKLYIMTSVTDEDIEISNNSTLYKYVPVNIQDVLSIDKFKQNKNLNQSQSNVIDDSLNNKENKSGKSESYSSNGKSATIIEY